MPLVGSNLTEDVGRNDAERRFLGRLAQLQPPYCEVWTDMTAEAQLVITVTISDTDANLGLRTLRVDFDGERFVAGNDPSHQITDELDADDPDRLESSEGRTPEEMAEAAMAWLRTQAGRPIERQEWDDDGGCWQRWVLADTGQALAIRKRGGVGWAAGGAWGDPTPPRPPDRAARVR